MPLKIAIIGAGPAGCMLARLLSRNGKELEISIFESDNSPDFRSQGGTLDLRSTSGLAAVKAAGLGDEFAKYARYDGEALRVTDKNYLTYLSMSGSKSEHKDYARPEIDRPVLRKILFESLPKDSVKWGKKVTSVDNHNTIHFQGGTTHSGFDLVVGADGAFSKVRSRISDVKPFYSGIGGYEFTIPNVEQDHKDLYEQVNRGSMFSYSSGRAIMPQSMGDGSLIVHAWATQPEDWQKQANFDVHDIKAVQEHVKSMFHDWDPRLVDFTQQPDATAAPRNLYMLPVGNTWAHVQGVTVIGDAAHLATPFAGRGVNEALLDALKLSQAIVSACEESDPRVALDRKVDAFEKDMFVRGKHTQEITYTNLQFMFLHPNAPRSGIEKFIIGALSDEMGILTWFLAPLIYAYYFCFKLWHPEQRKSSYDAKK